jgi:hypothetical protein
MAFIGGAPSVAQVDTLTPGGTIDTGNTFTITLTGEDGTSQSVVVTATGTTVSQACADIFALLNSYSATNQAGYSHFYAVTPVNATTHVTLTAKTAGVPFVATVSKAQGAGATNTHTFTRAASVANTGPKDWNTGANWSGGSVPANSDHVRINGLAANGIEYGLNQSAVTLASLVIEQGMVYGIGTPTAPLRISATNVRIGEPAEDGTSAAGSACINIDTGSNAASVSVIGSRSSGTSGKPPVQIKGAHASNVVHVSGGIVGIATARPSDTATVPSITVTGGSLTCGSGATLTTIVNNGGSVEINSGATTITQMGGGSRLTTWGTGAVTTANIHSGTAEWGMRPSSGNGIGTLNLGTAGQASPSIDFSANAAAITVATTNYTAGRIIAASASQVTYTATTFVPTSEGRVNDPSQSSSS